MENSRNPNVIALSLKLVSIVHPVDTEALPAAPSLQLSIDVCNRDTKQRSHRTLLLRLRLECRHLIEWRPDGKGLVHPSCRSLTFTSLAVPVVWLRGMKSTHWAVGRWRTIHGASLPSIWVCSRPHAPTSEPLWSAGECSLLIRVHDHLCRKGLRVDDRSRDRPISFTHEPQGLALWWSYDPQLHPRRRRTSRGFQSRSPCLPLLSAPFFRRHGHMSRARMHVCCATGDSGALHRLIRLRSLLLEVESVPLPLGFR